MSKPLYLAALLPISTLACAEEMPWESPESIKAAVESAIEKSNETLKGINLEELKVEGTLKGQNEPNAAIIRLPNQEAIKIYEGTRIGNNEGVVKAIKPQELEIHESIPLCGTEKSTPRITFMKAGIKPASGTTVPLIKSGKKYVCAR